MMPGSFKIWGSIYCPGKEAAMGIIVVSLPCTAYLWAALIAFCWYSRKDAKEQRSKFMLGQAEGELLNKQ